MINKEYEVVYNFLGEFFNCEFYKIAIKNAKGKIDANPRYQVIFKQVKDIIYKRILLDGEPLSLIHDGANQVLDENSDREAYIWLEKMLLNIDRNDGNIDEY